MRKIFEIENRLIRAIQESRQKMVESFTLGDLEKEYLDLVEQLYFKGNSQCMSGRQAKGLT